MAKDKAKDDAKGKPEAEEAEGQEGQEGTAKKGFNLKFLLMFVIAPVLVLALAGGGAYFFLFSGGEETADAAHGEGGGEHGSADGHGGGEGEHGAAAAVFFDLPEILVNLAGGEGRPSYLKLSVALELPNAETQHAIEPLMPRVVDNFQVYLRELRIEDLQGSAGLFRLKEELIRRVNLAVAPSQVKDVLFKEMLIQ